MTELEKGNKRVAMASVMLPGFLILKRIKGREKTSFFFGLSFFGCAVVAQLKMEINVKYFLIQSS